MQSPELAVASLCAAMTRALLLHLAAVTCAVALALAVAGGAAGLQVVPSASAAPYAQGAALGLLAASFFSYGLVLAWRSIAAEAPLTGESFAAQLRRVARADAWLGRGLGLGAELPAGEGGLAHGPAAHAPPAALPLGAPPPPLHPSKRPPQQRMVYMVRAPSRPPPPKTRPPTSPSQPLFPRPRSRPPFSMVWWCPARTSQRRRCARGWRSARCTRPRARG